MPHTASPRGAGLRRAPFLFLAGTALACAALSALLRTGGGDEALFRAANAWAAQALPGALPAGLTLFGHGLVAAVLVSPFLLLRPAVPLATVFAVPAAALFSRLGKLLAASPRPAAVLDPSSFVIHGQVLSGHNSFPSGHSITAFALAAVLLCCLDGVRARFALWALAFAVAAAVAASRVFVGAHWPSDALGGAALGCVAGMSGAWAAARWPLWRARWGVPVLASVVLACSAALWFTETGYPQALGLQRALSVTGAAMALLALARRGRAAPAQGSA
jgi:membrane-associated phospholipid phosphatase